MERRSAPHGIFWNLPHPAGIEHCNSFFKHCRDWPRGFCIDVLLQVSPQKEKLLELHSVTEEVMKLAIDLQSIFFDESHSTTTEHIPHRELEDVSLSEITISAS
jgi:hypothetical protein